MIEFLLNQTRHQFTGVGADCTLLDYLREQLNRCGTKEGCASGDCGACTVVVAELSPDEKTLEYRAINACITFAGSVDGKQVLTVEDLAAESDLHPVQQAMRDLHGSQCGFCTPGFIMSMFALWKNVAAGTVSKPPDGNWLPLIDERLGGNLCRCTGYRPIVDACLASLQAIGPDQFDEQREHTVAMLHSLQRGTKACLDSQFFLPQSLTELDALLASYPQAQLVAGGTDLALEVTQKLKHLAPVISLQQVAELRDIVSDFRTANDTRRDSLRIGAAVTLSECQSLWSNQTDTLGPDLAELLRRFGSTPVRNQGTIGGNIATASPIGDLPPALLVLDAELVLYRQGRSRTIPINEFFSNYRETQLQPGEIIREVVLSNLAQYQSPGAVSRLCIYKISKRFDDDISAVCMAVSISMSHGHIQQVRLAFGGMAAIPKRALHTEAVLLNQSLDNAAILARAKAALADDFKPIDDVRASARYRLQVAQNLLERLRYDIGDSKHTVQISHYGS
ncbi:MAG: xanthine dehydrogenase small subunit [Gammaproteobacteria bacterium]|nr:xanthine dehydrogenase small subunit [Gammaproteobacteria bacterium]